MWTRSSISSSFLRLDELKTEIFRRWESQQPRGDWVLLKYHLELPTSPLFIQYILGSPSTPLPTWPSFQSQLHTPVKFHDCILHHLKLKTNKTPDCILKTISVVTQKTFAWITKYPAKTYHRWVTCTWFLLYHHDLPFRSVSSLIYCVSELKRNEWAWRNHC